MDIQKQYNAMVAQITAMIDPPTSENYYPIVSTPLELHSGIVVSGTFETDDASEDGRMSYVTVKRDISTADPANGMGFAWTKGDGSKYNVYLVDNSVLANDLFITPEFVVNPQGENSWKAAAKVIIEKSTDNSQKEYNFELTIGIDYSMSLKLWKVGDSKPGSATVYSAAPATGPVATGTNFGIGILGTQNSRWWYNNIIITTANGIHTAVLFQLKARTETFADNSQATVKYYGYGSDGNTGNENWGLTAFIYKKVAGIWTWVEMGTNESTNISDKNTTLIKSDFTIDNTYRDTDNMINVLTTSTYAATAVTDVSTYYIDLESTLPSGIHTGGCADIYINDPSRILTAEVTLNNVNGNLALSAANGFLGPLHSIVSVETSLTGDPLVVNTDWSVATDNATKTFSVYEYPYLTFYQALLNYKIRVVYRYYHDGPDVQALLDSDEYRFSGTSNLAKIMPPAIVTINTLDYKGSVTVETLRTAIKNYINAATTIYLSDIINLLYYNGVVWIDIANIDISISTYDYNRVISDSVPLTDLYTIGTLNAFFADDTSLNNLRRI